MAAVSQCRRWNTVGSRQARQPFLRWVLVGFGGVCWISSCFVSFLNTKKINKKTRELSVHRGEGLWKFHYIIKFINWNPSDFLEIWIYINDMNKINTPFLAVYGLTNWRPSWYKSCCGCKCCRSWMQCKDMTYGKAETLETKKQQCTHLKFNSKVTPEKLPGPNMGTQKEQALVFGDNFDPSLPVIPPEVWCFRYVFGVQIPLHQLGRHVFFCWKQLCHPMYSRI